MPTKFVCLSFLLSVFTVSFVDSTGLGWIKNRLPLFKHNWGKLSEDQINKFKQSFGKKTNVDRFLLALDRMNDEMNGKVQSDAERAYFAEKSKHLKKHVRSSNQQKSIDQINSVAGVAGSLYGGDMKLSDAQVDVLLGKFVDEADPKVEARKKRQAYYTGAYPVDLWGTTFYYYFDAQLPDSQKAAAKLGIDFWRNVTCINFVENATAPNRVRIFKGIGCNSNVGMIGGEQSLSLDDGCDDFGVAVHELGHALGFNHEQVRYDRNASVSVNMANVKTGQQFNYKEETVDTNYNYGMPYDFGSIMQYGETAFSVDETNKTIKTMIANVVQYQDIMGSGQPAFYDVSMMNEHYQCKQFCPTGATCLNGGFRDSKNCNTCICPSGWSGATCSDRPAGCGAELTATTTLQTQTQTVGIWDGILLPLFTSCNFLIKAPAGNKVELVIKALTSPQCNAGCTFKSMEVKAISDHRYTGIRYCCLDDVNTTVVSEGHIMPVILNNRFSQSNYTFTYRYVPASTPSTVKMSQFPYTSATYDSPTNSATVKPTSPTRQPCVDSSGCPQWIRDMNFCDNSSISAGVKQLNCPIACKMCFNQPNTAIWPTTTSKVTAATTTTTKVTTTTTKATTTKATTTTKITTQAATACQKCNYNVSDYNEYYFPVLGTPAFNYRIDSTNNNCLVADWFCKVDAPYTHAGFTLWTGPGYGDQLYSYIYLNVNPSGFNDTTSHSTYRPFVCNSAGQWSFDGVTDFVLDCFAYEGNS
ncbi:unnamed protein product, partial [Mesorhabditis belari]|uniref:Zinc metalloproteinase n=1 Tax=Mesorhabditis belari TaxID=2138241 RepID=A0AAF3EDL4_9BILA